MYFISLGFNIVISCICLLAEVEAYNKSNIKNYIDIYLQTPLTVLKDRDSKGLYKKYERGQISNIYGLDIKFDVPKSPAICVKHDDNRSAEEVKDIIIKYMIGNSLI